MSVLEHSATIERINGGTIYVNVANNSACANCSLKKNCGIFDSKDKSITVSTQNPEMYHVGQNVMVTIDEKKGWIAVAFGYIIPLILVLITLFTTNLITNDETAAGIYSLMILIPYYLILMLFKKSFTKRFDFRIKENA